MPPIDVRLSAWCFEGAAAGITFSSLALLILKIILKEETTFVCLSNWLTLFSMKRKATRARPNSSQFREQTLTVRFRCRSLEHAICSSSWLVIWISHAGELSQYLTLFAERVFRWLSSRESHSVNSSIERYSKFESLMLERFFLNNPGSKRASLMVWEKERDCNHEVTRLLQDTWSFPRELDDSLM